MYSILHCVFIFYQTLVVPTTTFTNLHLSQEFTQVPVGPAGNLTVFLVADFCGFLFRPTSDRA